MIYLNVHSLFIYLFIKINYSFSGYVRDGIVSFCVLLCHVVLFCPMHRGSGPRCLAVLCCVVLCHIMCCVNHRSLAESCFVLYHASGVGAALSSCRLYRVVLSPGSEVGAKLCRFMSCYVLLCRFLSHAMRQGVGSHLAVPHCILVCQVASCHASSRGLHCPALCLAVSRHVVSYYMSEIRGRIVPCLPVRDRHEALVRQSFR